MPGPQCLPLQEVALLIMERRPVDSNELQACKHPRRKCGGPGDARPNSVDAGMPGQCVAVEPRAQHHRTDDTANVASTASCDVATMRAVCGALHESEHLPPGAGDDAKQTPRMCTLARAKTFNIDSHGQSRDAGSNNGFQVDQGHTPKHAKPLEHRAAALS